MLQPKKPSNGLSEKDNQLLISELTKYAEEGASDDDLREFKNTFISLKKKEVSTSTPTSPNQKLASVQKVGSSDIQKSQNKTLPVDEFGVTNFNQPRTQQKVETAPIAEKQPLVQTDSLGTTDSGKTPFTPETDLNISISDNERMDNEKKRAIEYIENVDKNKSFERLQSEINDTETLDYLREGGKKLLGGIINPIAGAIIEPLQQVFGSKENINKRPKTDLISTAPKVPLATEINEAKEEFKAKGQKATPEQINKRASEIFLKKDAYRQKESNANDYFSNDNPEIQEVKKQLGIDKIIDRRIKEDKLKQKAIYSKVIEAEAPIVEKEYRDAVAQYMEKVNNKTTFANQEELNEANAIVERLKIAEEKKQNLNEKIAYHLKDDLATEIKDASEDVFLFTNNYRLLDKTIDQIVGITKTLAGGAVKLGLEVLIPEAEEGDESLREQVASSEIGKKVRSVLSDVSTDVIKEGEEQIRPYRRINIESINSFTDYGRYALGLFAEQAPILGAMFSAGPFGLGVVSAGSGGQAIYQMEEESKKPFGRIYTNSEKLTAGIGYSLAEYFPERYVTLPLIDRLKKSYNSPFTSKIDRELFTKGIFEESKLLFDKIYPAVAMPQKEGASEVLTGWLQEDVIDVGVLGKKKQPGAEKRRLEEYTAGLIVSGGLQLLQAVPSAYGAVVRKVSDNSSLLKAKELMSDVEKIKVELNRADLTIEDRQILKKELDTRLDQTATVIQESSKKAQKLAKPLILEVLDINSKTDAILDEAKIIRESNISKDLKQQKLNELNVVFNELQNKKEGIINGKIIEFDLLPIKEIDSFKKKALKELTAELNPDGTKNIKIEDIEITKKAVELYEESKPKAVVEQEPETQPQAEKQAEVVEVDANKIKNEIEKLDLEYNQIANDLNDRQEFDRDNKLGKIQEKKDTLYKQLQALESNNNQINEVNENAVVEENIEVIPDSNQIKPTSIEKAMSQEGVYVLDGEKGEITTKGDIVVFETKDKIIDLGTKEEVSQLNIEDFGIEKESEISIKLNEDNSVEVEGIVYFNNYSNPDSAISKDKDGNYSVSLETKNGQKRTFRGARAEQIVYETKLKQFQENATEQQIDRAIEIANEAIRVEEEIRESSNKRENKSVRKAKRKQRTLKNVKEPISKNEATPTNITPANGDVSIGDNKVGEVGVEQKPTAEVVAEENIQPSNDVGEVEVKNKVEDIDINDIENFLNEMYSKNNQNENNKPTADKGNERAESNSAEQNIGEPKSEEKAKKISLKGRTPIAKRKFKGDRAKANAVEPSDVYSLVLNYFVSGGKIGSASVKALLKSDSEVKARNNGFNGISKKSAKETDALAHDLWELALSLGIQTDTMAVKEAIEDIVGSHNTNQDITNTILKRNNLELSEEDKVKKLEDFYIAQAIFDQVQEQNNASDEEMQEAQGALDMLSDAEIIELANNQSKSYDDYLKDLEERRVTFNIGPFEEVGTVQSDGSIINDEGEIFSKESVSNVKQVNPKSQKEKVTKVPTGVTGKGTKNISASAKSLLKEIDKKIEDARQKVRTAKEALDRKAKSLDKEMAKDQENLFGERKSSAEAKLFDERVNAQARNKATESERNAIKTAQDELRKLIQTKKDVESGKINSNQVDFEDVASEENKQSEYKFSDSPSLKNAQAVDSSILPITPKATENILKNEGNWDKAIIGDVKNLGNGWFEVGKTVKGESILYSPKTDKAVTIVDSENKGGRNAVYVNDFINNNPTISKKQQRKDKLNTEVDKIAQKVKDFLPGIKDGDNIIAQGFSQDQLIDLIANAVKNLVAAGIDINEAIKQVVESIKDKFGVDVNPDDVKAKLKSERNKNFKKKSGKKSVLGRAVSGGEPLNITEEIEKYGLDYEVESQAKAQENAKEFVKAVGRENALIAVRSGQIKGAEKAFVYAEIIDGIVKEMDSVTIETPDRIALNAQHSIIMGEIMNEFDIQSREAGRFISALNRVYFSTYFKYNLSRQINLYKARNGGEISPEKLQEYKETDAKLKELERKIEEAEKRAEEAEAKLAMENIVEEVERNSKKQKPDSNAKKAKILAEKIRRGKINRPGIFMSATPASLVWDGAIEIVAKSVEAGGTLSDAIKKGMDYIKKSSWYQSLSDSDKNEAEKSFEDHVRQDARPAMVYIDEDGNIKVPESLIRSLVEQGVKDIDELSQKVLDTIIDEYPDLTLRQVRDAITKYGKTINPDPDTISTEIRKLKRLGKLISGLEDAKSGKRPLKSGLQRDEITQLERKLKRELKDLLRDLPLDDDSVKKTWKTALDAIKSRLRNQIEDLEKQIANKEKSKPEKTPVEYDEEAKALKQKRDDKKAELEALVGKPELSEEKKIIKAIAMLEKSIQNLNEQIADNNIAYKIKPTPVTSARIEELKKQKAELVEQIKQMRIDSGIAEARRLQSAKSRIKNRIAELEKRIKEKNYTTKKPTPLKADQELLDLQAEKIRTQEVYDKDKYIDELKNRTDRQKAIDAALGFWGIPRVVMATGEASWIFIQGGIQTVNRTLKNPVQMFKIFKKMFKAMASDSKAKEYESLTKARKDYPIMKQAKLALTEVDHKLEAKEEQFLGDYANTVWDFIGVGLRKLSKNKEYRSPFSYFRQMLGKELNSADKATIEQYWKNINPLRILERGNTVYMNELRMARFEEGIEMLQSELKDPIEDIEDYKMLASAINTMTGRANIDSLQANSKILAAIFFSFRNAVSVFNQLNPIFYLYQLHNPKDPITKVSVAQKIAVADMMRFVTFTTGMMLLLQAAMGDDEEGNPKMTIETDPRSSDFGKMKMGDLRIDPWHGMMPMIVLISRMSTDESKNVNTGEVTSGGTKFGTRTRNELAVDFVTNKFNPSMGILWGYGSSHKVTENGVEIRKDMFGNEINILDEVANLQPMYWDAVSEIKKEQPGLWGDFFVAAGALGINSQVYDKPKPKVSSGFNRPRKPSFERPKRP